MKRPANHQTESGETRASQGGLRALIVDDETLARQGIRMLLDQDAEIKLIKEASNGKRAAELMLSGGFDLIFLDVQMPEMDGITALRHCLGELSSAVIFVTAYDQYAVEAFEVNAADYLLKPFTPRRCLIRRSPRRSTQASPIRFLTSPSEPESSTRTYLSFLHRKSGRASKQPTPRSMYPLKAGRWMPSCNRVCASPRNNS